MQIRSLQMKRALRSVLLILLLNVVGMGKMDAQSFTVDNLRYTVNSDGVSVTVNGLAQGVSASGELVIPEIVTYNGSTYSVTTIGDWAFWGCSSFTGSLIIPNSVTTIGNYAFQDCSGFTGSLTIPNSVTTIGNCAFDGCSGFTGSLTIPNSVTTIGTSAFRGCNGLTGVYYTGDIKQWCNISFSESSVSDSNPLSCAHNLYIDNELVTDLVIPDDITEIKASAFSGATCLTSLTIPNSVTKIGAGAFYGCNGLTGSLTIPNSVTTIDGYTFYNCTGFTGSLTIPNSVTSIGYYAFYGCSGFTGNLIIPNSVTSIGYYAFYGCSGFTGNLIIPNSVTSIGYYAFYNCSGFTGSLTLGNSMTTIGDGAFCGCSGFTGSLTIPNSVTSIGNSAFNNCTGFSGSLTIPNSVTTIGDRAFYGCSGFTGSLTLGNSMTTIGNQAFYGCSGFTGSLTIPNSVTFIDGYAFYGCSGLTAVQYTGDVGQWCNILFGDSGSNPLAYAHNLFIDNELVTDLIISETVTEIKPYTFYGATCLTSLSIPNSVTTIGDRAFYGCSGFTGSLTLGNSVTTIGNYAFYRCSGFTGSLTIPNSVTTIGDGAFYDCSGFTGSLTLGNSMTTIGNQAFYGCSGFTGSLTLGNSMTTIGNQAFYGCSGSLSITSLAETPPTLSDNTFKNWSSSTSVYVPCGFEEVYTSVSWGGFSNFYEMCGGTVTVDANPEEGGVVMGGGSFGAGQTCTVTATANEGYAFAKWTQNGIIVSMDSEYTFYVTGDMTLVAHFASNANIDFADANVKAICVSHWDTNGDGELSYAEAAAVSNLGQVFRENTQITSFEELQYFIGLSSIGNSAFYQCSGLTGDLIIPNSVTEIGQVAFYQCSGFTGSLTIGNSVIKIGLSAFNGCSGFTGSLTIPNSVTTIGNYAFYGCSGFNGSLTIGNSVTSIGYSAFYGCSGFTEVHYNATNCANVNSSYRPFSGCGGSLIIGNDVERIPACMFYNCGSLTNLTIGSSVTTIGGSAFYGCSGFTGSLTIPNSVTTIGYEAFANCSGFTGSLTIPNSVTSIGYSAFYGCSGFTGLLTIPNSVTTIGEQAFLYCSGFTGSLTIPNSVTSIGNSAFSGCSGFTGSLTIPNSVTSIGNYAFDNCRGLTLIEIPSSVTYLGSNPFRRCRNLEQIIVASDNAYYDSRENCNAIIETNTNVLVAGCKTTVIPNSVTSIGSDAFSGCSGLTSIEIPNSVTSIGGGAFSGCSGLTSIEIPNSVSSIGNSAFYNCSSLTSIEIPNFVTSLGNLAFYGCSGLNEIMMFGGTPPSLSYNTYNNTNSCPIYVPYKSLNAYKTASNWSYYEDRIFPMAYTTIPGYGEGVGNYHFIASPLVEDTDPTTVDNMITETAYDLYRFDQSEEAEWQNYKTQTESFVLVNGQGYLYANAEEVNVIFKGNFNEDDTKEVELAYDANADFAGWNLVGNPFPVSAYANRSYYTMNEDGTAVEPNAVSSATPIPACTGIMVMAEAEGETVVFSTEAPEAAPDKGCLQIALSQVVNRDGVSTGSTTLLDKAIVSFNAGDRLEKFVFNKDEARISIPQSGKELAIACTDKQGEVPLNFKATKSGQYTLTVNNEAVKLDYLHLIDNLTGADVDLLAAGPSTGSGAGYTFTAKTTDYASRFRLVFSANDTDGPSTGSGTFAFVNNGNIIINGEGVLQIVDVMGRIIVSEDVSGNISTANMIPGVYVLRLINGNDVKTQKIVIE